MNYIALALGLSGVYMVSMTLITQTNNPTSALVFKVLPFFIGLLSLVMCLKVMGLI